MISLSHLGVTLHIKWFACLLRPFGTLSILIAMIVELSQVDVVMPIFYLGFLVFSGLQ